MSVDIKVRGYHLDIYHHVNNSRYLEFLEEGRWDYFDRHRFLDVIDDDQLAFVVANINISYRRPAFDGEVIRIVTRMGSIGNKSAQMQQQVMLLENGEPTELVADATITFCLMDAKTQRAIAISGKVRAVLEKMIEDGL
ncbi:MULTISPECIES: thioesterase family protein [unclassified Oceanobacter]|jgi:thioesterase-3|uniref:acyl-CoA thioesterase n=1 Tax=unclassified Oceanobacter TaxID=2620260 RepID=UPI0026E4868B|nr:MULTISPECIES: YbgC/FadM family acyl-CoA thioesterase [unclassified Oceanobacter]MDO6681548.1 YbgC/FadM family acyl-CoA thioesterase [Oceanobacter sp. 5_MG-2023]MDP2507146.1 YbgC/FadM family acyl-CoA thioesterase [Oceanobacter sp. 3_MG-2023]MDP2549252.1 YbgC/FadM family acyl-CoA thioesterase [Oceanobacter sp. 4_MG-2023]MDP2610239.1 YbgC/FadM family acyl-CoA thioesterase [Oceanobacter sp. 1_MG-2023]MDP2613521.1 YbgC/FadM family acyl-CoA thioesterase [Oceanobacter sp. 2_MG-2023]